MYHLSVSQPFLFFIIASQRAFLDIYPLIILHGILLPQIYCVSVHVQWPFESPQTIIISRIIFTLPVTSLLSPLRMQDVCVFWYLRRKRKSLLFMNGFFSFMGLSVSVTLSGCPEGNIRFNNGHNYFTSNYQTLNICLGVQYYFLIDWDYIR